MHGRSQDEPSVVVNLFGGPTLLVEERDVPLSPLQSCLVALVFSGDGRAGSSDGRFGNPARSAPGPAATSRRRLVRFLWGQDSPETRHRLSQLLYSLSRKEGGRSLLRTASEAVSPGSPGGAEDVLRFQRLLDRGDLVQAVELVERGYLSRLQHMPGRAFEEWWEGERARVRGAVRSAAARAWTRLSTAESWREASRAATAILRLDPLDESALRNVLLSRGMAGQVREALAAYARFKEEAVPLEDAWTPRSQTRELIERLATLPAEPLPPPELAHRGPEPEPELCGRDEELAVLNRAVSMPGSDTGLTTILVTGEAGIGKTRLVGEALRGAHMRGFTLLRARSSEFERDIPLNPLLEALDHDGSGDALHRLDDPWRSVLLSLLPQFHRGSGPLPEVPYIEAGNLPRRTYEALRLLFSELGEHGPLLLFLDDFQWADETSVAALEFLRRRWSGGRLVIVLAARQTAFSRRRRAEEFVEEVLLSPDRVHLPLEELDEPAANQLIDAIAGQGVEKDDHHRISVLGGRNPFFTIELTHDFVRGQLELQLAPGDLLPVPVSIRQLLERRLHELTPAAEQVLHTLAVHGRESSVEDLAQLCEQPLHSCAAEVDRLQELRLLRWAEGGVGLRHQLIRHTVYNRLKEATRSFLHGRVGEWLRSRQAPPGELALHFDRAGRTEDALRFALEAADGAEASGAVPEAVHFLTTARRNTTDPQEAAEIVGRLGHLHYLHRSFTEAAPLLDIAAERFRQLDRVAEALEAEVERIDALSRLELLPFEDFIQKARELKNEARTLKLWETLTKLLDVEIHTLDREGKADAVREVLKEAEEICDMGSPAAQCAARATLAVDIFYRDPTEGVLHGRKAVELARLHQLPQSILIAVNRHILGLMLQGTFEISGGEELYREVERVAATSGDLFQRYSLSGNRAFWHSEKGEYQRARHFFTKAEQIVRDSQANTAKLALNLNAGECEFLAHNVEQASIYFNRAGSLLTNAGIGGYMRELVAAGLGICALYYGDLSEARRQEAQITADRTEWVFDPFTILLFMARMYERRSNSSEAAELLNHHSQTFSNRFVTTWIKLKLEEARLLAKRDKRRARLIAEEGMARADALNFQRRSTEFRRILDN